MGGEKWRVPELPETETIARDLDRVLLGARIGGASITRADVLRGTTSAGFIRRVTGAIVAAVWRRAKVVVLNLDSGDRIAVQPRFTGSLLIDATPGDPYAAVILSLSDGRTLTYRDVRRLGTVALLSPDAWAAVDAGLGPEPLDPALSAPSFSGLLARSRQPIKVRLMDQRTVAGIGNIYATEALWHRPLASRAVAVGRRGSDAACIAARDPHGVDCRPRHDLSRLS